MTGYTNLRNLNRGYMKLEVWQKGIELYKHIWTIIVEAKIDFKLRTQIADAAQSVSSNIAEGYSRRSINEYLQHLYISLGSLSETLSRVVACKESGQITREQLQQIDSLHYEVENKLLSLVRSLEKKKDDGTWVNRISEGKAEYHTLSPR